MKNRTAQDITDIRFKNGCPLTQEDWDILLRLNRASRMAVTMEAQALNFPPDYEVMLDLLF